MLVYVSWLVLEWLLKVAWQALLAKCGPRPWVRRWMTARLYLCSAGSDPLKIKSHGMAFPRARLIVKSFSLDSCQGASFSGNTAGYSRVVLAF